MSLYTTGGSSLAIPSLLSGRAAWESHQHVSTNQPVMGNGTLASALLLRPSRHLLQLDGKLSKLPVHTLPGILHQLMHILVTWRYRYKSPAPCSQLMQDDKQDNVATSASPNRASEDSSSADEQLRQANVNNSAADGSSKQAKAEILSQQSSDKAADVAGGTDSTKLADQGDCILLLNSADQYLWQQSWRNSTCISF